MFVGRLREAVLIAAACLSVSVSAEGQLFKKGGLFSREPEAPRLKTEDEIGVPVPVTGRVEALEGHEVQFEIRAESKTPGAMVEFLIRDFPTAGRIVSLVSKPLERNKAIVTYVADPDSGAEADVFSFAVRYRGGRYSSAMRYDIDIVNTEAEIQVPESVDFGQVMIGDEEVREINVRNLGSGSFSRQLILAAPWHLVEPEDGNLTLGPKGSKNVKVAFRPDLTGETSYFLSLSRSKTGTTKLVGEGAEPFSIVTETLELQRDPKTRERRGEIVLLNRGPNTLRLEARGSSRLENSLLEEYFLPPEAETKVRVRLGSTDTAPFDGTVEFFLENGYAKSARVFAPVVPGEIKVSVTNSITSEVINFGKVSAGKSTERGLTLTNVGGVAMPLEFHIPEPFRLLTNPGPKLAPLSSVQISVGLYPGASRRGMVDSTMNVFADEQTIPIRLLGNVVRPKGEASDGSKSRLTPNLSSGRMRLSSGSVADAKDAAPEGGGGFSVPDPAPQDGLADLSADEPAAAPKGNSWRDDLDPDEIEKLRSPLGFVTRPLVSRELNPELREPEDLSIVNAGSDSLTIGWTAPPQSEGNSFEVELRGMIVAEESGVPESVWAPYGDVAFERIDRLVKAKIKGLAPVSEYEFRVVMMDGNGRSSEASEAMVARTEPPMDWTYIYLCAGALFVVLLGFGIWEVFKDRQPEVYQSQYVDV